ncbi:MAG TPA: M1 family aminopeptidase [Fimbriiglobus sp.]|nr:M1 family aminopeptidase [Fimbriiglobus sp.]
MPGRLLVSLALLAILARPVSAAGPVPVPDDLPRYDLALTLDVAGHVARFRQTVTWTNRHDRPTESLAFNFYPYYRIPSGDRLLLAKTLELLRLRPEYGIDRAGRNGVIDRITLAGPGQVLAYHYSESNPTTMVIELPRPVARGESVTVAVEGAVYLPNKQGRFGQWDGITYLANGLPVVAYYDEGGWHDTPFIPWHQPFWNEAGVYTAAITLPADQVLACSAGVASEADLGNGWKRVVTVPFVGRDFAVLCSADYREYVATTRCPDGREVKLRCVAHPRHEFYAKEILRVVGEAIPVYCEWFGPFPYDQFTVAEAYFGWNGNECAGLVMIDERVFDMPKLARGYVEYLVSHETCHQWWYNQVGTNGYAETFMDEGAATYFTHRLIDLKRGKNNELLDWPWPFGWMPNIRRDNYRFASLTGAIRRGDAPAAIGELPKFGHLVALFSGAYDRGSKVFGLIEQRLGPEFLPFVRELVKKYSFRVLSAAELRAELIAFTGPQSAARWDEFFAQWVYGNGLTDWKLERVSVEPVPLGRNMIGTVYGGGPERRVTVTVRQTREIDEPTVVAFQFADGDGFPVRIPIGGSVPVSVPEFGAEVEPMGDGRYVVRATLPAEPTNVAIDPDRVLLDANPADNTWRQPPRVSAVPLYTMLNETDLTNDYDRWNVNAGPWFWGPTYLDPWYTRSSLLGARVGVYRTQTFAGGVYTAVRPEYRDAVVGADGLLDHWPWPKTQVGFNVEARIAGPWDSNGEDTAFRAYLFGRYVFRYSSSLYLHPLSYLDAFTTYSDNFLPFARTRSPGAVRPSWTQLSGLHYRLNLYTPYWDPDRGVWVDLVAAGGVADLAGVTRGAGQLRGELAAVRKLPDGLGYLSDVKAAGRVVAMGAVPAEGQFFALGGGTLYRGFDLEERQGSFLWVANTELRLPLARNVRWNVLDNLVGGRNLYAAGFYDVGAVYADGRSVGGVAHALGAGLRLDLAFFSFIERATVRFDVGKTINAATPFQFWFGVQQPF